MGELLDKLKVQEPTLGLVNELVCMTHGVALLLVCEWYNFQVS